MKKRLKNISFIVIGLSLGLTLSVFAYSIFAEEVGYNPTDSEWSVENSKEAIDDLHNTCDYCKSRFIGISWDFPYEGSEHPFKVPLSGVYKLEVWGAQGGSYDTTIYGGYGGYSVGEVFLNENEIIYINVGGKGSTIYHSDNVIPGGYNGGGSARSINDADVYSSSGGGATHIATSSGLLSSLASNSSEVLIVAGGGGGSNKFVSDYYGHGGVGGGMTGEKPVVTNSSGYSYPNGLANPGTQVSGGTYMRTCGGSVCYNTQSGSFGQGGGAVDVRTSGGGGGYYGGASGARSGGAGGSGFIASSKLKSLVTVEKHMTCYSCTTSDSVETKTRTTTDVSPDATPDYAKKGDGYARITLVMVTQ